MGLDQALTHRNGVSTAEPEVEIACRRSTQSTPSSTNTSVDILSRFEYLRRSALDPAERRPFRPDLPSAKNRVSRRRSVDRDYGPPCVRSVHPLGGRREPRGRSSAPSPARGAFRRRQLALGGLDTARRVLAVRLPVRSTGPQSDHPDRLRHRPPGLLRHGHRPVSAPVALRQFRRGSCGGADRGVGRHPS
jgi:hypothetical protein